VEPPAPPPSKGEIVGGDSSSTQSTAKSDTGTVGSPSNSTSVIGEDSNPLLAQSDDGTSDFLPRNDGGGVSISEEDSSVNNEPIHPNDKRFSSSGGSQQWSVFITSVASAVVAVAVVLTVVGCVVKARRELLAGGSSSSSSGGGIKGHHHPPGSSNGLPYSSGGGGAFGEEGLMKGVGLSGEYTEPFTPVPPLITFPNNHSGGGDKKAEYYSVTLIPTNNPSGESISYKLSKMISKLVIEFSKNSWFFCRFM